MLVKGSDNEGRALGLFGSYEGWYALNMILVVYNPLSTSLGMRLSGLKWIYGPQL